MKKLLRFLLSPKSKYTFYKSKEFYIDESKVYGAYIHIPFCKNMCPYCPYYKIPYNQKKISNFLKAIKKEISLVIEKYPKIRIDSLYIGGGTPTVLDKELINLITYFRGKFKFNKEIAIEIHPTGFNENLLKKLKEIGVTHISLGIQTFNDKLLKNIGRMYNSDESLQSFNTIKKIGFNLVSIDMMFALPQQGFEELKNDLDVIDKIKPDQVTFYPLFTFPYSKIGEFKQVKNVKMPRFLKRKEMYSYISSRMVQAGYKRVDVWSFKRIREKKFSSVTRDYYIGFGPSAGTYTGKDFYFNTFSFEDYIKISNKRKPTILNLKVDERLEKLFWLYWRFYETEIPKKRYRNLFNSNLKEDFRTLFYFIKLFKFIEYEDKDLIVLNQKGVFYIHLMQNFFALDYINKIWNKCQKNKNPNKVKL